MKYNEKIKDYSKELAYLIIILFFIINSLFYFNSQKNDNIDNYMGNLIKEYQLQYETLYENFNELSQNTFYGIINKPEIYNLIKHAYKKDKKTENFFREELYSHLLSDYNRLVNFNFEQLHFHYPNNTSFLRMHKVNKFGDDLTNIRFGVNEVNKNLKPLSGFEIGKVEDGFRYIYPLFDENLIHIGSAEVSVNSKFFEKKFERNYNLDSHFLLNKSIAKSKMFDESFDKYDVSYENNDYIYSENQKEEAKHFANSAFYSLDNQKKIKEKMNNAEKFIIYEKVDSRYIAICFLPIKNIENIKNAAYMVLYKESEFIKQVINNFYKMILIILLLTIIVVFYFSYIFKQKKEGIVLITIKQKRNILTINIQDSAGGIPNKIIKNIFDPYFTTKHKSLGVGLGLFSTYEIVNKVLKGSIYVENKEFDYNFKKYKGACFTIILNKDKLKD